MCGRSEFLSVPRTLEAFAPARVGDAGDVTTDAVPGSWVPGIVLHHGERVVSSFRWGFFDDSTGHNARLETAPDRPAWREAYSATRLIMPLAAFVEGRAWFRSAGAGALAVAGLYRFSARGRRATMLTRPADPVVAPFHDRMPVVLPTDLLEAWLALEVVPLRRLLEEAPALAVDPPGPVAGAAQPSLFDA